MVDECEFAEHGYLQDTAMKCGAAKLIARISLRLDGASQSLPEISIRRTQCFHADE